MATWYTLNLNDNGGSGSTPTVAYARQSSSGVSPYKYASKIYVSQSTSAAEFRLTSIPKQTCFRYKGHYTDTSGGYCAVGANGYADNLASFYDKPLTSSPTTVYAQWTRRSYVFRIHWSNPSSLEETTSDLYCASSDSVTGDWWYADDLCDGDPADSISFPRYEGLAFRGVYSEADGQGVKYINADGSFTDDFRLLRITATTHAYAHYEVVFTLELDPNGGAGGTAALYTGVDGGEENGFFFDDALTQPAASIVPPLRSGWLFSGYFIEGREDEDGNPLPDLAAISQSGEILSGWSLGDATELRAHWRKVVSIELDKRGGSEDDGTESFSYDSDSDAFYDDSAAAIRFIEPPVLECFRFLGYYSAADGGSLMVSASGEIQSDLRPVAREVSGDTLTLYARWLRVTHKAALHANGGDADAAVYSDGANFYADDLALERIAAAPMPHRAGHSPTGYFTAATGGEKRIDADGSFILDPFDADLDLFAQWTVRTYIVTFDYAGGRGAVATKTVTWNQKIGTLPVPSAGPRNGAEFDCWTLEGQTVTADTVWTYDADAALLARWIASFSDVVDYFGLASSALVPFESDSGDDRQRVATAHMGRYAPGVNQTGVQWRNPVVRYMVVKNCTVSATLGKGYPAAYSGKTMTATGFMLTSVAIETAQGQFPVVTVSGVANEGKAKGIDAINLFPVMVPVLARARPQNLLGAVSGGGELQSLTLAAFADPVVVSENLLPCASDVVKGRWEAHADTLALDKDAAPTGANGFAATGEPARRGGTDYWRYSIAARKEMA